MGENEPWVLKDLRKTCATYYDEHMPESSIEILGHSVGGITYRHYAHRAPLAFKAIMTLPQPSAFARQGIRRRVPLLPAAIRRRCVEVGDVTDAHPCRIFRTYYPDFSTGRESQLI